MVVMAYRVKLADALILIAATAIGFAWFGYFNRLNFEYDNGHLPLWFHNVVVFVWLMRALPHLLAPVTFSLLILSLRRPRPRLRRLSSQPGTVAAAAVLLAVGVDLVNALFEEMFLNSKGSFDPLPRGSLLAAEYVISGGYESLSVCVAWLLLAASGRWRRGSDWTDFLGIALGVFWLVAPPLATIAQQIDALCSLNH
jgi:hypothetical protein